MYYHDSLHNETDDRSILHARIVRARIVPSFDRFFTRKSKRRTRLETHKQRVKIVKSETQRNLLEIKVMVPFSIIIATLNVCNATIEYRKFSYFVVDQEEQLLTHR